VGYPVVKKGEKFVMDLGAMKWSTPAPVFKWGLFLVGIMLMTLGLWGLWNLETTGTIFVRGSGRIAVGHFIWGYRFVLAAILSLATAMVSAWYWFPKIRVFENGVILACGRRLLWSDKFRCEQIYPGAWVFENEREQVEVIVYDAPSIKRMALELKNQHQC
jgi:hypothetical protein